MRRKIFVVSIFIIILLLVFALYYRHLQKEEILREIFINDKYQTMTFIMGTNYESQETIDNLERINQFFDYLHEFKYMRVPDTGTNIQEFGNCVFYVESDIDIIIINIFNENTINFIYSKFDRYNDKSYNLLCRTNADINIEKLRKILGNSE